MGAVMTDNAPEIHEYSGLCSNLILDYKEWDVPTSFAACEAINSLVIERDRLKAENRYWSGEYDVVLAGRADEYERAEKAEAELEKWKKAFAAQSRKLQSVLHIEGVREALQEKPHE